MIANKKNLVHAIVKESTLYLPSELLKLNLGIKKKKKKFKLLNEKGNWFKIFTKKTREFNTIELLWKGHNLTHRPCAILPSKNIHQNIDL